MESAFRNTWTYLLLAFMMLALCVGAFAQGGVGELTGLVTDTTGAVIAGVQVKLTNSATGEVRTTVTTPAGIYRFPALQVVGSYTLEVATKGFKTAKVQNIVVTVGTIITRDVKLEVGATTEQVTVEAGAQLVQAEDAALSQNVDRQVWTNMPLETRSQNDFMGLVVGAEPAAQANIADRGPAVNGTRSGAGNFMVDGFSNNDQGLSGGGVVNGAGGAVTSISPDAVEEYRVIDGTPSAEYGQAGGFVTDTVLKSGTNAWHGSLFEYNRIQALAANSWFSNAAGEKDHLIRNQFGGSAGGPIVKDKTFFYFTTEYHRLRTSNPLTGNTFTSDFENFVSSGAFETFMESGTPSNSNSTTGGICYQILGAACPTGTLAGAGTLGPVYSKMAAAQPPVICVNGAANCKVSSLDYGQGLYTGAVLGLNPTQYPTDIFGTTTVGAGQILNQARYAVKVDHKLGAKDQLNGDYLYDNGDASYPYEGGGNLFGPTEFVHTRAQTAGITWSHTFSPTILNQARMSYVRHTGNFPGDPSVAGMPDEFSYFDENSFGFGNTAGFPQLFTENEFIYKDDLSVTRGKHNFKGGWEYRRTRNGSSFDSYMNGELAMEDTEDMLTDGLFTNNLEEYLYGHTVYSGELYAVASLNPQTGQLPVYYRGYRANEYAGYVQDDWRISPRLFLNLGVRWEYFGPPHNFLPGIDANFYQGVQVTPIPNPSGNPFFPVNSPYFAGFATGTVQQRDHNLWNPDTHNFGPRIGLSWDVLGNQKLVMRAGYGIMYDRIYNNVFENARFNPPYFAVGLVGAGAGAPTITAADSTALVTYPFTGTSTFFGAGLTPELRAMDQNLATPYYEDMHLGFQYQVAKDMVLESNYVGTLGHKLIGIINRNTYDGRFVEGLGAASPINPAYSDINFRTGCCNSNYHGWQTTLRKRFSNGLQFNANYTFSKGMDDLSDAFYIKGAGGTGAVTGLFPTDPDNARFDYGPADYNVKHRLVGSFVYDLPLAKSNRWIGGWQVNGIFTGQSGADFSVVDTQVDSNMDGQYFDRSVYLGPGGISNSINHNVDPAHGYLKTGPTYWGVLNGGSNTSVTGIPCPANVNMGLWCNQGEMERNTLVGPGFVDMDFGVGKIFKVNERASFKFEANFFNLFNHPNFQTPVSNPTSGNFGDSISTFTNQQSGGPRITQMALRFDF